MSPRENTAAGLFVLVGIVLALVVVFVLADFKAWTEDYQDVKVQYRSVDGLRGLKVGAAVTLGNRPVGVVTAIDDVFVGAGDEQRLVAQVVTVSIPSRYRLYEDAVIEIDAPAVGSDTKLNIRSVGYTNAYDPDADAPIAGGIAASPLVSDLVREAGIDEERRRQVQQILANVAAITDAAREDVPKITAGARRVVEKLDPLVDDADQIVADLRIALDKVTHLVGKVDERSEVWLARIDAITKQVDEATAALGPLLKDADPKVRQALADTAALLKSLREEAGPAAVATLERTRELAGEARDLLASQRPVIERTLANLQLAGAQLKLTTVELRRSPWRLLYRPTESEIAHDNLYDAARSFAQAAEAIQGTAESLQALAGRADPEADPATAARVQRLAEYLDAVTARFRDAEQAFWRELDGKPPAP